MTGVFSRTLKYRLPMMQGEDVRALQTRLFELGFGRQDDIDGLFGPGTRQLVMDFQRSRGIGVDGIAGSTTFSLLAGGQSQPPLTNSPGTAATPPTVAGALVPPAWMPPATMKRIILHWTAGGHNPSSNDLSHYHIVIDGDGKPHKGKHGIDANVPPLRSSGYAAHTRGTNSHSIGISACSMLNAREVPFDPGPFPLTEAQWDAMIRVVAELCLRYGIPVSRTTVLGHGEVQDLLGIRQNGKWDPMVLPWNPGLSFREVGDMFRARAAAGLEALKNPQTAPPGETIEIPPSAPVTVDGAQIEGASFDGRNWIDLDRLAAHLGWTPPFVEDGTAEVSEPALRIAVERFPAAGGGDRNWAEVAEISQKTGMRIEEDAAGNLSLISVPSDESDPAPTRVVVQRGQTLTQIARRWLGDLNRWRELRDETGQPFDEDSARSLRVGQVILLPEAVAEAPVTGADDGFELSDARIKKAAEAIAATAPAFVNASGRDTMRRSAEAILKACKAHKVKDAAHCAYILATANHETNLGRMIVEKWVPTSFQRGYVGRLGNANLAEAELYRGRGFVQITGKSNYQRYGQLFGKDFEGDPDQVSDVNIAAEIIVRGMTEFGFTKPGFVLSDLGADGDFDYVRARELINGDKNRMGDSRYPGKTIGVGVAETALKYREIITSV